MHEGIQLDEIDLYSGKPALQKLYVRELLEAAENKDAQKAFFDLNLVAECHIMFEALMATVADFNSAKDNILLSFKDHDREKSDLDIRHALELMTAASESTHEAEFSEKLWLCGQKIGKVSGRFQIRNLPFLSQMKLGLLKLRNSGISISSKQTLVESGHLKASNA